MISFKPATPNDISHIFALSQKLISTYEKEADLEIVFKWMKYKITQHYYTIFQILPNDNSLTCINAGHNLSKIGKFYQFYLLE